MTTEKRNKLTGICASLALHGLAAAVLIFSVSGHAMIPRDSGKLDLVWVSLPSKDKISFSPDQKDSGLKAPSAVIPTRQMPDVQKVQEIPATRNSPAESDTTAELSPTAADHKTTAFPESEPAGNGHPTPMGGRDLSYATAESHYTVSDAGPQTAASGVMPAFSDAYPLYKENPPPGYPAVARQQGYQGVVFVAAEILADGRVGKAVVSKSSGYAILDQTAVKAVRAWKFEPAKKSGVPCKTWAELPIKFVLNDNTSQS